MVCFRFIHLYQGQGPGNVRYVLCKALTLDGNLHWSNSISAWSNAQGIGQHRRAMSGSRAQRWKGHYPRLMKNWEPGASIKSLGVKPEYSMKVKIQLNSIYWTLLYPLASLWVMLQRRTRRQARALSLRTYERTSTRRFFLKNRHINPIASEDRHAGDMTFVDSSLSEQR